MENISYDLKLDKHPVFPIFTSSLTIETTAPEEKWMSADDVVKTLSLEGVIVSKQTLFNKERAGVLTTKRQSARKVFFKKNPMAINYPQWIAFAKYSYSQLKWALLQKPELCDKYVSGRIYEKLEEIMLSVDQTFEDFSKDYIVVFE